jgi:cytochrome P450
LNVCIVFFCVPAIQFLTQNCFFFVGFVLYVDVSEIIFDERLQCVDENKRDPTTDEFVKRIDEFFVLFGILAFQPPIWKYYPTKDWKAFEAHGRFIYSRVFEYIKRAQDKIEKEGAVNKAKTTVLSQYLSQREKYGIEMNDILAIMNDFLVAGMDTTAISIYHLMYELGLNQEVQQILYDEIVSVVKKDEEITEDHIEKLKYLKMVVKESGRFVKNTHVSSKLHL